MFGFSPAVFLLLSLLWVGGQSQQSYREGFFNSTSYVSLSRPLTLNNHIGLSFRSCHGGQLFSQRSSSHYLISLEVRPDGLVFMVTIIGHRYESKISANLLDNEWHNVDIINQMGNLNMSVGNQYTIIANSTYNSDIISKPELFSDNAVLVVGNGFSGCLLEGPSIVFDQSKIKAHNVAWGPCPLPSTACGEVDLCAGEPCMKHGRCISLPDRYLCQCTPRYTGANCHIENGPPCERSPCKNGAECIEDRNGDFTCTCPPGFTGKDCGIELSKKQCEKNPCKNNGTCISIPTHPQYECICIDGFSGNDCENNINECLSNPCQHGGICIDGINEYSCNCDKTGYSGPNCEMNINECDYSPCQNSGICFDNYGGYTCQCPPGYGGQNCETRFNDCASNPCLSIPNSICIDTSSGYQCGCRPGYRGPFPKCTKIDDCGTSSPCLNGATCSIIGDSFHCTCLPGFTGFHCEKNIDDCLSSPCKNGGTCFDGVDGYTCNCTLEFTGPNCEIRAEPCIDNKPCLNNATCIPKPEIGLNQYHCECLSGFKGHHCENNIDDCINVHCGEGKYCVDGINSHECVCSNGLTGPDCSIEVAHCINNQPCLHGGTCNDTSSGYVCICPPGFTGRHCETDIDECALTPKICVNGICQNHEGSYQCFCTPGFSGDNCEVDIDECLSNPCTNGATCENLINKFNCICPPGYTGRDCSIDVNECESNPCTGGSTCVDRIASFTCVCPAGLTGRFCETNIDDCESSPCLNNGICIDGLNNYTCNCTDSGFEGDHCETNIDDCANSPCVNGGTCIDEIKGYKCLCYGGYEGINCEVDINECEGAPCQNGGTCYERSNPKNYVPDFNSNSPDWPTIFTRPFDYSTAVGFECICIPGINGSRCENNINDCDPNPCKNGQCTDQINHYICECDDGFEGDNCEINIDECDRYRPCVHGTCIDKRAGYDCECDPQYGGKNCSVELLGCVENKCQNEGTCTPYLENEVIHKFNCSCPNGFHGDTCDKETTMSVNGNSYVMVNTTRDEGYDISFRFKTTLSTGVLAFGNGNTYYFLALSQGRLNLHTSLLNKWEGVFIGSNLNDSNWHKVFVAINASHVVLSANEEQTIYPISMNEAGLTNPSQTTFPTTYVGGTISYLRKVSRGPGFTGCIQDVIVNNQWVLPEDRSNQDPVSFVSVDVGCHRTKQCSNSSDITPTCHNGGHCTDLWNTFSCTCQRPFLGNTCQYNLTAATFGHDNINNSLVTVTVDPAARRAVRSILDISMFIRTREPAGEIFYLGSTPYSVSYQDETIISAKLSGGELQVRIQFNGTPEKYTVGGVRLDNGYDHLIQVVRNVTLVQVKINSTEYFRKTISASGQLDLQTLQLGTAPANPSEPGSPSTPPEPNFKGIIQDVQVSNGSRVMVVEFFPLSVSDVAIPPPLGEVNFDPTLVLEGIVSDDSCASSPCMNGGVCTVTWNDFSCNCTVGYKGKQCEEMEFCRLQDCPVGSECRNLNHGYECVANITIHELHPLASPMEYNLVPGQKRVLLNDVTIMYRSKTGGTLLQIGPDQVNNFFFVSVFRDQVTVRWDLGDGVDSRTLSKEIPDGSWVRLDFKMTENKLEASNGDNSFVANFSLSAWTSLLGMANITLGASHHLPSDARLKYAFEEDHTNTVDILQTSDSPMFTESELTSPFRGCLGEVRIGGILLPYFTASELNMTDVYDRFEMLPGSLDSDKLGCRLCFDQQCANGGRCLNATETYKCNCTQGFDGDDCTQNIDECVENDCKNNATCIDGLNKYTCDCLPGWQGSLCDKEIDECATEPCLNGATCVDQLARYECICPEEYTGETCADLRLITCENQPCHNKAICHDTINPKTNDNFTCVCQEGFVGVRCERAFCEETPCLNNGTCVGNSMKPWCVCRLGYRGRRCEENIDDCASAPCHHGGKCIDQVGKFICECDTGFTGTQCEIDIDECVTEDIDCGPSGICVNTVGSYHCQCPVDRCGPSCNLINPCREDSCANGGSCDAQCTTEPDYICHCAIGFKGKNCTVVSEVGAVRFREVALIVGPLLALLLVAGAVSLTVFLMMARKKRATRGTYSPSSQEYCNPRVELDNVMKPPPEERLI